ncbi:hypothetical protein C8R45DRAFT_924186 [Mycena sanguinolenta]|nr:hypothetical protein C8R45DRAFT_924186 [Mycena sanguinolenta]
MDGRVATLDSRTGFDNFTQAGKFHAALMEMLEILEDPTARSLRSASVSVSPAKCRKLGRRMRREIETFFAKMRSFRNSGDPNQLKVFADQKEFAAQKASAEMSLTTSDDPAPAVGACIRWCEKILPSLKSISHIQHGPLSWTYWKPDELSRNSDSSRLKDALQAISSIAELLPLTVPPPTSDNAVVSPTPAGPAPMDPTAIAAPAIDDLAPLDAAPVPLITSTPSSQTNVIATPVTGDPGTLDVGPVPLAISTPSPETNV